MTAAKKTTTTTKQKHQAWIEEQCKNMEKGMMSGCSKEGCNTIKAVTKTQQHKYAAIEEKQWKHPDGKHSRCKPVD